MDRLALVLTNSVAILPFWTAMNHDDFISAACIANVAVASAVSHFLMNHKHGFKTSESHWLSVSTNAWDVIGCAVILLRLGWLWTTRPDETQCLRSSELPVLVGLPTVPLMAFISERQRSHGRYVVIHSIWHIAAFYSLHKLLVLLYPPGTS